MQSNLCKFVLCLSVLGTLLTANRGLAAEAVDHAATLTPFLNDDSFAVVYLNVASLPKPGNPAEWFQLLPKLSEEAPSRLLGVLMVSKLIEKFHDAGGQGVYAVTGLLDLHDEGGPLLIATAAPNKHPEELEQMFNDLLQELRNPNAFSNQPLAKILDVRRHGDVVLVGTKDTVNRYTSLTASERKDFTEPLTRLTGEGAVVACVFAPGPDYRRIHRELWPTFPPPMTALKGELADRWRTFEFAANLPPNVNPRLMVQTTDPEAAQTFVDLYRAIPAAAEQLTDFGDQRHELKRYLETIVGLMPAHIDNTRVTLSLSTAKPQLENLHAMLSSLTDKALESSRRRERILQFKQLALAMHNFYSDNRHFPPNATVGKDGQPQLSWRVAILPYIDQNELYKQFHLDEPWDSPHNRTLIDKMPNLFADPDPKVRQAAGAGKTTYQVPVGPETIFHDNLGTKYGDVVDGTSKTVLIVEVEPLHAAAWTKPEDWEVDLQHPRRGIERTDRNSFTAAYADGSVQMIPTDADENVLRANLTRGGREVVDRP